MYKVFVNNKSIVLTDQRVSQEGGADEVYLTYTDFEELQYTIELLEKSPHLRGLIINHDDLDQLWTDFRAHYEEIDAGGGLVRNADGKFLLIYRRGKWDLPKGKIEEGETPLEGALREVEEECGITDLTAGKELQTTYHTYDHKGMRVLKRTYWFEMTGNQKDLVPQTEEDIEKVEWMTLDQAAVDKLDTYPNIRLILEQAIAQP